MKKLFTLFTMAFVMLFSTNANAQCNPPANLAASYSNNVSTFSWDAVPGAVDYTIEIKQPFDPWVSAEVVATVTTNSYDVTGIFHSASVDWRVSTNCGSSISSYSVAQYTVPCPVPGGLNVTNVTSAGATLNWIPAAGYNTFVSDFVVSYRLVNTNNTWTQIGHTSGTSINVTGLAANTAYEWCVNQTCVYFNSNPVISQFTTALPACSAPTGLVFTYSNNVSTFTWNPVPGAVDYRIQIGWAGANWGTTEITVASNSYSITNLMQGGNFQFRVRTNCGSSFSTYTPILFTTPCSAPGSLTTTNITPTSATLNWVPAIGNNGNTVFAVAYRLANTNNGWTTIGSTTASSINVTGLTPGTLYEWCVNKVCSVSNSNPVVAQFTTAISTYCVSYGNNSSEWIDLFRAGTINRVSGAETGGYINTGLSTNLVIGSSGNVGQISAGFPGAVRAQSYCVYIDFNRNGSFTDAGERVFGSGYIGTAGTVNFTYNIPATATPGATRMRVVMRKNNTGGVSSCITGFLGETEDYTVNLSAPSSQTAVNNIVAESNDKIESSLTISPNPSGGLYTVSLQKNTGAAFYEVVNMNGSVVKKQNITSNSFFSVDITRMPKGLYLLKITDQSGKQQTHKLMKN